MPCRPPGRWAPLVLSLWQVQNSGINRWGIGLPSARNSLIHLNFYPRCQLRGRLPLDRMAVV